MTFFQVSEIFHSIQGEGPTMGLPTTFVRLVGCPLRCRWCDSEYAFTGGQRIALDQIIAQVRDAGLPGLCLTGGEPLVHKALPELLVALDAAFPDVDISVETSGAYLTDILPRRVRRIVDWKAPSSGEGDSFQPAILADLTARDAIKFVINASDFDWLMDVYRDYDLVKQPYDLLLHPIYGELELVNLADWMVNNRIRARMGLQLHKLIWPHVLRGV